MKPATILSMIFIALIIILISIFVATNDSTNKEESEKDIINQEEKFKETTTEIEEYKPTQINPEIKTTEIQVDDPSLIDNREKGIVLYDEFEQKTKGEITSIEYEEGSYGGGNIRYVEGREGYGILHEYHDNPNGGQLRANSLVYENPNNQILHPNSGTVEFWAKNTVNLNSNENNHGLFTGHSHNGKYSWYIV